MALIIGNPKFQWFIATTGQPAVGYLLYSYEAGTTTPTSTWQDTDLLTLNTNPIVLDAAGTANVVTSGVTKLVLKDPDGATIWSFDDIGTAGSSIDGFLTFVDTPSAVNYFSMINATTGNSPIFESTGGDSNIGSIIRTKGTGTLALSSPSGNITATAQTTASITTTSGDITLTTTSGAIKAVTNSINFTMPSTVPTINKQALIATTGGVSSYSVHAMPAADGVSGSSVTTNGSGVLSCVMVPPTGALLIWSTTTAPTGYLECNGAAVSRTTYAALFAVIGTTFGSGDGSTTFNLPQTQRQVIVGRGGSVVNGSLANTLGSQYGEEQHILSASEMPAHTHSYTIPSYTNLFTGGGATGANTNGTGATTGSAGSGSAHNNFQPSLVMMYIIKT